MKNTARKIIVLAALLILAALLVFSALRKPAKPAALSRVARERIEALDDALKNGLISRTEHDKRVAQIVEDDAPPSNQNGPSGTGDTAAPSAAPASPANGSSTSPAAPRRSPQSAPTRSTED
jgi:hypothetical protein